MSTSVEKIFAPIFAQIAHGALNREEQRRLPAEEISWLKEAGILRLRVPQSHGGFGLSLQEFFGLLIDLGAADSNIVQALRGHIGFVEFVRNHPNPAFQEIWFARIAAGALVGNAESERTGAFSEQSTQVAPGSEGLVLNGNKYYTTGSIFADWIHVSVILHVDGDKVPATVQVPRQHPGVQVRDDWDGFGQRLTGSGTTLFSNVPVVESEVTRRDAAAPNGSVLHATYQLVHLAALAGIANRAVHDVGEFVQSRARNLFNPGVPAAQDPVALQIIGSGYGTALAVRSTVLGAAASVDEASLALEQGHDAKELLAVADAHVYGVQPTVIELVVGLTGRLFDVGGASAVSTTRGLDRHWRNARTISSHNPVTYRQQAVGDYLLNKVPPGTYLDTLVAPATVAQEAKILIHNS